MNRKKKEKLYNLVKSNIKNDIGHLHVNVLNNMKKKYEALLNDGISTGQIFAIISGLIRDSIFESSLSTTSSIFTIAVNHRIKLDKDDLEEIKNEIIKSYTASVDKLYMFFKADKTYKEILEGQNKNIDISAHTLSRNIKNKITWYVNNESTIQELQGPTAEQIANRINFAIVIISLISLVISIVTMCCS